MAKKIRKSGKKKFFEVKIPLTATKVHLYGYAPEDFEGKIIKLDMTKSLRGKNLDLKAKVKLENNELEGEIVSLQILPSHIAKVMRRGTDYVEDSFETNCKDALIRIKPFIITRKRVSRDIRKNIRNTAKKLLEAHTTMRTSKEIFSEIMSNKLQKELSIKIKKIYPLALCEIRMIQLLKPIEIKEKTKKSSEKPSKEIVAETKTE